jgi:hypothetical protein
MPDSLPSLNILRVEATRERELVLRHADAVDTKAGVVLGAAAALTALGSTSPWQVGALPLCVLAACAAVGVLWPAEFRSRELAATRHVYLTSEPEFTELMLLDSTIELVELSRRGLETKAKRLKFAAVLLLLAGVVLTTGTITTALGG